MAIIGSVRLLVTQGLAPPHIAAFSPQVVTVAVDPVTRLPTSFYVNASIELLLPVRRAVSQSSDASDSTGDADVLSGTLKLIGDWGNHSTVPLRLRLPPPAAAEQEHEQGEQGGGSPPPSVTVHAVLHAKVPDVKLWWPLHYGAPNLHRITAEVTWDGGVYSSTSSPTTVTKRIGFRSVALYTGDDAAPVPAARTDPSHAADFVGCYRDGNPYWGCALFGSKTRTCQNALPHVAAKSDPTMTVSRCIALCGKATAATNLTDRTLTDKYTLAGLQDGTNCFCGHDIGSQCKGCYPLVGTLGDPSECGAPCGGDATVACGGASYMWASNSVYNVSSASVARAAAVIESHSSVTAAPAGLPLSSEGSGDSAFAVVVNGVKIFSRGANFVPFELLEATVNDSYVRRTLQSVSDGGMNMLRVWGGGMYQLDLFYDECDRLGIMLYHDAMFCQRFYPHDAAFVDNVKAELTYQVQRLRVHPSIVLWDSSNENEGDPAFYYATVLTEIATNDGQRPLWPASPSSGFSAGVHTDTGLPNGNTLVGRFAGTKATLDTHMPYDFCTAALITSTSMNASTFFKSEFGQVSLPAFETIAPMLNGSLGDYGVFSPVMLHRKHAGKDLAKPLTSMFGVASFDDTSEAAFRRMIFLSQLAQTLCIKTYFEVRAGGEKGGRERGGGRV